MQAANELDLTATQDTGVIRGVVVDPGVVPLSNVQISVRLQGTVLSTNTSETGAFGLEGLEPGTYFITASKAGFSTGQTSTDVVAGNSNPDVVKLTLEPDASTAPYYLAVVNKGYIECSVTAVFYGVAACSVGPLASVTADLFLFENELSRKPTHLQSEMLWDSTQELGDAMALVWSYNLGQCGGLYCDSGKADGISPLLLMGNATIVDQLFSDEGNRTSFIIRVFNSDLPDTRPPPGTGDQVCVDTLVLGKPCARRGVGLTFEQSYEIYSHAFFGYQPPEWRLSSGAAVPAPPA